MGPLPWGGAVLDPEPASLRERLAATQPGHFKTQFKFCLPATSHPPLNTLLTAVTVCFYGSNLKVAESWNPPQKSRTFILFRLVPFHINFLLNVNKHLCLYPWLIFTAWGCQTHKNTGHTTWDKNLFSKSDSWLSAKVCLTCQTENLPTGKKGALPIPPSFK